MSEDKKDNNDVLSEEDIKKLNEKLHTLKEKLFELRLTCFYKM